jgi:hypothetical protein
MPRRIAHILLLGLAALVPGPARAAAVDPALWEAVGVIRSAAPTAAPGFTLNDLDGKAATLSEFRGRLVMLYFWATW